MMNNKIKETCMEIGLVELGSGRFYSVNDVKN